MRRHSRLHLLARSSSKHLARLDRRATTLRINAQSYNSWRIEAETSALVIDYRTHGQMSASGT